MARDDASLRQITAARPDRSTWLSANAGSGKTKVLTDRVARLLLDGVDPQHILCLTYTKAAASEMQNRLFDRLGGWAMLDDEALGMALRNLGEDWQDGPGKLNDARRLFAKAIETPGGLKIQTIHSFCSAVLRRFPLESGVTPNFTEMEDRAAKLLRAEVVEKIAAGTGAQAIETLAWHHTGSTLDELTAEIVRQKAAFARPLSAGDIAEMFGQPPGLDETMIENRVFLGGEGDLLRELVSALSAGSSNDRKAAEKLSSITTPGFSDLPVLENLFLNGPGAKEPFSAKIGSFPTKACRQTIPGLVPDLDALMTRVEEARTARLALRAMHRTQALHDFARIFLPAYEHAKQMRGWLDFDDLILRARELLTDPTVADWVLYKLDGGLDHILVDEAQDTSPAQWQVIERLAQEFTSGAGARPDTPRTIFVVGDKKQSIYSFQGADPREFDRMKTDFGERLSRTPTPLQDLQMEYSFRSAQVILDLVDATFRGRAQSGFAPDQKHVAFKKDMPGRIDLWPVEEKPAKAEDPDWFDPVDTRAPDNPGKLLARRIAVAIRDMIGTPLPDAGGGQARAITAGDILILVQRRSDTFHDIIRECKTLGLPVAGADRLRLGGELAVKDLGALLSFLATPEDDLALASVLRSPLLGWSEAELYRLAHNRDENYLWAELRKRADEFPLTLGVLRDMRDQADYLRPYDLIERMLTRHDGRRRLLARLGPEAEDGIDALLSQAMAFERGAVDSLTGFLVWMETDNLEIKRQMDSAGDRIRVMTVHGAKGLESPVVILPDTAARPNTIRDQLAWHGDTVLWRSTATETTQLQAELDEAAKQAQQAERDRLLYVAMTRAEQWLIVAAAGDLGKDGNSWHEMIRTGMERLGARPREFDGRHGLRIESAGWAGLEATPSQSTPRAESSVPDHFHRSAPAPIETPPTLSPSELGGAKALADERGLDEDAAKKRGRQIHRLLEWLPRTPEADWPATTARILSTGEDAATDQELETLLEEAAGVVRNPEIMQLFTPETLAEVPVSATLDELGGRRIHGVIDLLLVEQSRVLAIDFKTNAAVPACADDCPEGLLRQMGAYAAALGCIYPGRNIETALLWTRTATLMPLPHDLVIGALRSARLA
ncbi:double-strand break repair helicase AddA [Roseovarius salis]|uniref:double-strand break repair helicase AddA n=1 Tax=Roseovarius salis TaxID=3376063 RepID=UPI0037C643E7